MNILLINHYAGSPDLGMEHRPYLLARAWAEHGHRTRIVAATFSHLRNRQPRVGGGLHEEGPDGLEYFWIKAPPYQGNGVGRIRNMMAFVRGLYRDAPRMTKDFVPDVVVASSTYPLDAYPARRIARMHRARLVHEVHDLWPLSPMELGKMPRWHPFIAVMQLAENAAYRNADLAVSILPAAEEYMREHGLRQGRFVHVPNGIDPRDWGSRAQPIPEAHRESIARFRARFPFLVGYAGAHGLANSLDMLLDAAALCRDAPVGFVLVGQGPHKDDLRDRARSMGLENVIFLDPVPKLCVPDLLASMDGLFIGIPRLRIYRFGIGMNKLIDYMMAARPVVCAIQEDAGNDLVSEARCGFSVQPDAPASIAGAVRDLIGTSEDARRAMGARGREFALRNHSWDILSQKFLAAFEP